MFNLPQFIGPDAQDHFNQYIQPAVNALSGNQHVKIEIINNTPTLVAIEKPTGCRWFFRWFFSCFVSENQRFENVSRFILELFEANQKLLDGKGKDLLA